MTLTVLLRLLGTYTSAGSPVVTGLKLFGVSAAYTLSGPGSLSIVAAGRVACASCCQNTEPSPPAAI